mmetsp:Transcript_8792/g.27976  ORF Transcript_8792/g.27976 Transcript_8792/m.27976 type:complete len:211 (+) Transcript_8792:607-1239(+)
MFGAPEPCERLTTVVVVAACVAATIGGGGSAATSSSTIRSASKPMPGAPASRPMASRSARASPARRRRRVSPLKGGESTIRLGACASCSTGRSSCTRREKRRLLTLEESAFLPSLSVKVAIPSGLTATGWAGDPSSPTSRGERASSCERKGCTACTPASGDSTTSETRSMSRTIGGGWPSEVRTATLRRKGRRLDTSFSVWPEAGSVTVL